MTTAILDGYEEIQAYREGAKFSNLGIKDHGWHDVNPHTVVMPQPGIIYIAPIRLRLGENYRCKDGQDTGPITSHGNPVYRFWSELLGRSYTENGESVRHCKNDSDIVAHIPKEEKKMEAPKARYQSPRNVSQYTMGERAIQSARTLIEGMDADPRLTEAGNKIEEALLLVMEYTDEQIEKKRQKEIKLGDKVFDHRFSRWWFVASIDDDGFCYAEEMKEGGRYCGKPDDLVKISDEEFATLEAIKSRVP